MRMPIALTCSLFIAGAALPASAEEGLIQGLWNGNPSCLIATVSPNAMTPIDEQLPPETGPRDWWVADLGGVYGQNRGGAPVMAECGCLEQPIVPLVPKLEIEGPAAAANVQLRLPAKQETLSTDSAAYVKAAEAVLAERSLANAPVRLTHVLRTDFEGDGVDEVLLAGGWNPFVAAAEPDSGYYTFLLLRRLVDGAVETSEVEAWWEPSPEEIFMPLGAGPAAVVPVALFDADGDGTAELVTASWGHEFLSYHLYRLEADGLVEVAACGCGC